MKNKNHSQKLKKPLTNGLGDDPSLVEANKNHSHKFENVSDRKEKRQTKSVLLNGFDNSGKKSADSLSEIKRNEGICKCGHHSKDHSYSLAPKSTDLECDICHCQNYEFDHFDNDLPIPANRNQRLYKFGYDTGYQKAISEVGYAIRGLSDEEFMDWIIDKEKQNDH